MRKKLAYGVHFQLLTYRITKEPHDCHVGGGPFHTSPRLDAIDRFMDWYNHDRVHHPLDWENQETLAQAFSRKMPPTQ